MALRQQLGYPPFSRLVNVRLSGLHEREVEQAATAIAVFARDFGKKRAIAVLGPVPAPLSKIKDRLRWQVLLKSVDTRSLHGLCDSLIQQKTQLCPRSVVMQIDVDPENML